MEAKHLFFIVYDGIENSVFESQVLTPLLQKLETDPLLQVHLVSFEQKRPQEQTTAVLQTVHPRLTVSVFTRSPFWASLSLYPCAWKLRSLFKKVKDYRVIARGPFAGRIASLALTRKCTHYTIQARGLLAEEYRYTHKKCTTAKRYLHALRAHQLARHEGKAYAPWLGSHVPFVIEAVSRPLQEHLTKTYKLTTQQFTLAKDDIPQEVTPTIKKNHRTSIRKKLGITEEHHLYVYSGSAKPWQCPHETITFFKNKLKQNPRSFLLILSPDTAFFKKLCQSNLPQESYSILHVAYADLYAYLCASDTGILFREKVLINWVSRPTKYLEYKAAGLSIVHNNTVGFIQQNS